MSGRISNFDFATHFAHFRELTEARTVRTICNFAARDGMVRNLRKDGV